MDYRRWDWAVGRVGLDCFSGGNADGRDPGSASWRRHDMRVRSTGWQNWMSGDIGARAAEDEVSEELYDDRSRDLTQ